MFRGRRESREERRFHETSDYRLVISDELNTNYPLVTAKSDESWHAFIDGSQTFVSFNPKYVKPALQRDILLVALQRAHSSKLAAPEHGKEGHSTYELVLDELAEEVKKGSASLYVTRFTMKKNKAEAKMVEPVEVERYILEAPQRVESVYRPDSHKLAVDLKEQHGDNLKPVIKEIKKRLKDGTLSAASALLTFVYFGLDEHKIVEILSDTDFRQRMRDSDDGAHLPHKSKRRDGEIMVCELIDILGKDLRDFRIVSSPDNHKKALASLRDDYSFTIRDQDWDPIEHVVTFTPIAIFRSASEVAYWHSPRGYREPDRTVIIDENWGGQVTTEIITAYRRDEDRPKRGPRLGLLSFFFGTRS